MTPELSRIYTYKELCELFNQKYRDGKSKMYQLREWSRYFKWEHPVNPKTLGMHLLHQIYLYRKV